MNQTVIQLVLSCGHVTRRVNPSGADSARCEQCDARKDIKYAEVET